MDREKSLMVLVHCSGKIKKSNRHGVKFTDKEPLSIFIRSTDTLSDLKRNILQKAGLAGAKLMKKVFYKILMAVVSSGVQYETFVIRSDEEMGVLFHCRQSFLEAEFEYWFDIMRIENPVMCDWANRLEYDKWTQHQDGGRRFGHMTTNISECVNSVLKGTQNLPVTALVKSTYGRLAELFIVRGQIAEAQLESGQRFCQALVKAIERNLKDARDRTCDCGYFQALHYPCCHAIACCAQSRLDWATYIHEVYTMSKVFNVYRMGFLPPILEGLWPTYAGPTIIPDPNMRRAREGRPMLTRIRNTMDEADTGRPK
ncbi:uncharacterized protein [Arachis hypogaea]|uniref:uncharacterized protein n=1 Tax=Arachis hypogaea TaxID=3818 RepID=UPI003B215FA4